MSSRAEKALTLFKTDLATSPTVIGVLAYLREKGWKQLPPVPDKWQFIHSDYPEISVYWLPTIEPHTEYTKLMTDYCANCGTEVVPEDIVARDVCLACFEDYENITNILEAKAPQHQGPLDAQLRELVVLANKAGLYDAADFIKDRLK